MLFAFIHGQFLAPLPSQNHSNVFVLNGLKEVTVFVFVMFLEENRYKNVMLCLRFSGTNKNDLNLWTLLFC